MIMATLGALLLFFGGGLAGGHEQMVALMREAASECVAEAQRRNEVDRVLARMQREMDDYEARLSELRRRLLSVDGDYGATAEEYRAIVGDLHAAWMTTERRLVNLRFDLRDLMTPQEWYAMMGGF